MGLSNRIRARDLSAAICEITGIPEEFVAPPWAEPQRTTTAAQRISWAASRETARAEDRGYSLMGLLDINMPLLYGEGTKAFMRLQVELMKEKYDHTLLAWGLSPRPLISPMATTLYALSPEGFLGDGYNEIQATEPGGHCFPTNLGIHIDIRVIQLGSVGRESYAAAILDCKMRTGEFIALPLHIVQKSTVTSSVAERLVGSRPFLLPRNSTWIEAAARQYYYLQMLSLPPVPQAGDHTLYVDYKDPYEAGWRLLDCFPPPFEMIWLHPRVIPFLGDTDFLLRFQATTGAAAGKDYGGIILVWYHNSGEREWYKSKGGHWIRFTRTQCRDPAVRLVSWHTGKDRWINFPQLEKAFDWSQGPEVMAMENNFSVALALKDFKDVRFSDQSLLPKP